MSKKGIGLIRVLLILLVFTIMTAFIFGYFYSGESGNVALIPLEGEITASDGVFGSVAISGDIVKNIEDASLNPAIEAIVLDINSPGGTIVASKEIAAAVRDADKPTICWLRELAASGAYWVASNCDVIVADEHTLTGSIGVIGSYLELTGFFEEYGIGHVRLVSGEKKDTGTPFREPTEAELRDIQMIIDELALSFQKEVQNNRNLTDEQMEILKEGSIFLGNQAKDLGLVDILGGKKEVEEAVMNLTELTTIDFLVYKEEFALPSILSSFLGKSPLSEDKLSIKAR